MSKSTGPIINGTSADVTIAGWMALGAAVLVGFGLYAFGLSASIAAVVGIVAFVVGIIVASVKTVG